MINRTSPVNPLTKEHILVSPHRTKRPWMGQTEPPQTSSLPSYDEKCLLCPGNARMGGQKNPNYQQTFAFENDFAAILPAPAPAAPEPLHSLMTTEPVHGGCDVLMFHPRHDLTLARMSIHDIGCVITEWIRIYLERGSQPGIEYVQIFENKGSIMGCSNPHPHGQIWSLSAVPTIPMQELRSLKEYATEMALSSEGPRRPDGKPCMLCDYAHEELKIPLAQGRVVVSNEHWLAIVPWWATWPFETMVLPYRRHVEAISDLTDEEKMAFADIIYRLTRRYDNLFSCSFAYSMGMHQRPVPVKNGDVVEEGEDETNFAHLHLHFDPPLLRSASVRKFLVGFEMMAEAQRDLTPEQAAARLRDCSEIHYTETAQV
ncbi:hypothetical protein HYPSUDRAFT_35173 [Hypholoma sublateritium FD-334 SS-4]|uniref:Galactose-1-phosphate uridylyltransferase n=1 Tax=Hypholoma sublateritium (strain FD-334 SS-4) TaxID=945553 RepID=A0A0D2MTH5_HYPSF|nr:hypothetical protein HYPSUDRAFT_35173 [Hypholoma sublateritium FD-334 SS-4]